LFFVSGKPCPKPERRPSANKQLTRGATPRIEADPLRRRNTSIALEEVKRGLIPSTNTGVQEKSENDASLLL
jgi:hypothetical protein